MSQFDLMLDWYERLEPGTLHELPQYYSELARFKDPFNDVQGLEAIRQVFVHMFAQTDDARFVIREKMEREDQGFALWTFHCTLSGRPLEINGVTHFQFDGDGRVSLHRDYWDSSEELFQKITGLGWLFRWLRNKVS